MSVLCCTCLSRERALTPLHRMENVLRFIDCLALELNVKADAVCWECRASLIRVFKFRLQALKAQAILQSDQEMDRKTTDILSGLRDTYFLPDSYWGIVQEKPDEPMQLMTIKQEIEVEFDREENIFEKDIKMEPLDITEEVESEDHSTNSNTCQLNTAIEPENSKNSEIIRKTMELQERNKGNQMVFIVKTITLQEAFKAREQDRVSESYQESKFKCESCIVGFDTLQKYNMHLLEKHDPRVGPHTCSLCSAHFPNAKSKDDHFKMHLRRFGCRQCPFTTHRLNEAVIHGKTHEKPGYTCKTCSKVLPSRVALTYHRDVYHSERPRCAACHQRFHTTSSWDRHRKHTCTLCDAKVCTEEELKKHLETRHKTGQTHTCPNCKNTSLFDNCLKCVGPSVKFHHRVETKTRKTYTCDICKKTYLKKTGLVAHMLVHSGERPHCCMLCSRRFRLTRALNTHVRRKHLKLPAKSGK